VKGRYAQRSAVSDHIYSVLGNVQLRSDDMYGRKKDAPKIMPPITSAMTLGCLIFFRPRLSSCVVMIITPAIIACISPYIHHNELGIELGAIDLPT
jgi:hypothetical protein